MTEFIIFSRADILTLCDDKPVTVYINKKPYVLCTDEYFEKQRKRDTEAVEKFVESDAFTKLMESLDKQDRAATEDAEQFLRDIKAKEQKE